jgi:hypothetical protein
MLAVFLTALATQVAANLPFTMPTGIPDPLAYYWLNEGSGTAFKESVSDDANAGYVTYDIEDQPRDANGDIKYPGPTWVKDPHFGDVFQCGNLDTEARDAVMLKDISALRPCWLSS